MRDIGEGAKSEVRASLVPAHIDDLVEMADCDQVIGVRRAVGIDRDRLQAAAFGDVLDVQRGTGADLVAEQLETVAGREVEVECVARVPEELRRGFSATAGLIRGFKCRVELEELDSGACHLGADVSMDPVDIGLGEASFAL